jgi:hypothetical protein
MAYATALPIAAVALTALALGGPARAADRAPSVELSWNAPDACPSGDDVVREVGRLTSRPANYTPVHLSAEGRIEQIEGRWFLHLRTVREGVAGERDLDAASCASLARAAALVLALALGELAELIPPAPPEPAAPPPPPPPPIVPASVPAVAVAAAQPTRPARAWSLTLDARGGLGPLPGHALGLGAGVDTGRGWWWTSLRVQAWPGADQVPSPGLAAHYRGVGAALMGCLAPVRARFLTLLACDGIQVSALAATATGTNRDATQVAPWYALLPALRARWPIYRALRAELGVELPVSLNRPRFVINGLGDVHVVPRLAPTVALGLAFAL